MERKPRILLVEDSRLTLAMEQTFFQAHGFEVLTARDGLTALSVAAAEAPDAAILDLVMPDVPGTGVCERLKSAPATGSMPVVIVSATESDEVRRSCRSVGADRFVPKSAGREHLLDVLRELLKIPQRRSARIKVFFTVRNLLDGRETLGRAVDLSEGGMCLEVNRPYPIGADMTLRFRFPGDKDEIHAPARVCWSREREGGTHAVGVQFDELSDVDRDRLKDYIEKTLSTPELPA